MAGICTFLLEIITLPERQYLSELIFALIWQLYCRMPQ